MNPSVFAEAACPLPRAGLDLRRTRSPPRGPWTPPGCRPSGRGGHAHADALRVGRRRGRGRRPRRPDPDHPGQPRPAVAPCSSCSTWQAAGIDLEEAAADGPGQPVRPRRAGDVLRQPPGRPLLPRGGRRLRRAAAAARTPSRCPCSPPTPTAWRRTRPRLDARARLRPVRGGEEGGHGAGPHRPYRPLAALPRREPGLPRPRRAARVRAGLPGQRPVVRRLPNVAAENEAEGAADDVLAAAVRRAARPRRGVRRVGEDSAAAYRRRDREPPPSHAGTDRRVGQPAAPVRPGRRPASRSRPRRALPGAGPAALDGVDLALPPGEVLAVVGPSGSAASAPCCGWSADCSARARGRVLHRRARTSPGPRPSGGRSRWSSRGTRCSPTSTVADNIGFGLAVRRVPRARRVPSGSPSQPPRSA